MGGAYIYCVLYAQHSAPRLNLKNKLKIKLQNICILKN